MPGAIAEVFAYAKAELALQGSGKMPFVRRSSGTRSLMERAGSIGSICRRGSR